MSVLNSAHGMKIDMPGVTIDIQPLQVNFATKRHELNVSTYQMCVLLLFNDAERLSYREILEATQIVPAELKRNLQSLACVKVRSNLNPDRSSSLAICKSDLCT